MGKELEEIYNYVGWCILAHNIWFHRDDSNNTKNTETLKKYKDNGLEELILKNKGGDTKKYYNDYKIDFNKYPIFFLFCLVDSIEPLKQTSLLTNIEVKFEKNKIIIKSNDTDYISNVLQLNDWLTHIKSANSNQIEIDIK